MAKAEAAGGAGGERLHGWRVLLETNRDLRTHVTGMCIACVLGKDSGSEGEGASAVSDRRCCWTQTGSYTCR